MFPKFVPDNTRSTLFFAIFLLSLILAGCGNDLSRGKAEEMIKRAIGKQPITKVLDLGNGSHVIRYTYPSKDYYIEDHQQNSLGKQFVEDSNNFILLSQKGLLTYKAVATFHDDSAERGPNPVALFYYDEFLIELTPKAKPHVIKEWINQGFPRGMDHSKAEVLLADIDKVEVTGISKPSDFGQKMCEARFTIHYKPTPFGEVFLKQEQLVKHESMAFVLYDDGWRIAR